MRMPMPRSRLSYLSVQVYHAVGREEHEPPTIEGRCEDTYSDVLYRMDGDTVALVEYAGGYTQQLVDSGRWREPVRYDS